MAEPKTKAAYVDRLNPKYATNRNAEEARRQAERWEALCELVHRHGGWVTSPPGKTMRIEALQRSSLAAELQAAGYNVVEKGSVTRIVGATPVDRQAERDSGAPSPFTEVAVFEIQIGR
jgi:hypothetical protein